MYLILFAIFLGVVLGITQGIVMHQPNPRDHRWYQYYHRCDLLGKALLAGAAYYMGKYPQADFALITGLVLLWEIFELFYAYTRFQIWIPYTENVLGMGGQFKFMNMKNTSQVIEIHIFRMLLILAILLEWNRQNI